MSRALCSALPSAAATLARRAGGAVAARCARRAVPYSASAAAAAACAARPAAAASFWSSPPSAAASSPSGEPAWHAHYQPLSLEPVLPWTPRTVPAHIERPAYARPDFKADPRHSQYDLVGVERKGPAAIAAMRQSCALASYIRAYAGTCVKVGRSTDEIDALVHAEVVRMNAYPSPLLYAGFPKSLCSSVNQVVVHGIPDGRKLLEGDIVNIDVSVFVQGHHGDCSGMFVAGTADPLAANLLSTTRACLDGAIALCGPGVPFNAVGAYIQPRAHAAGFSVVKQFCGHGIGQIFHMPPLVYHTVNSVPEVMQAGMTFTIEPMLNEGSADIEMLSDGWTFVTKDGGRSAQYEETILITDTGCEIITKHKLNEKGEFVPPS